jgi:hypothetical protein
MRIGRGTTLLRYPPASRALILSSSRGPNEAQAYRKDGKRQSDMDVRKGMAAVGLSLSSVPIYLSLSSLQEGGSLPPLPDHAIPTAAALLITALIAKATVLKQLLHIELHQMSLTVQWGLLPDAKQEQMSPRSVEVRPTNDGRGNGAFATELIKRGSWLCDYEGHHLTWEEFDNRYPRDGPAADFATQVDDHLFIDAVDLVGKTDSFSAVHMNHSRRRANVDRVKLRRERRVVFCANRDIQRGEELLYFYGDAYWIGREQEELP